MGSLTVMPFLLAMYVAVAAMPTNVYQVCAWNAGTLEVEAWRQRASAAVRSVGATLRAWFASLFTARRLFAAAVVILALLSADLSASQGIVLATAAAGVPDGPTLGEVKSAIENSNRLFEEFKSTTLEKMRQIESKGVADPLITAKLEKLNEAIEEQSKVNEAFMAVRATVQRLELAGFPQGLEGRDKLEAEVRQFNIERRALAAAKGVTVEGEVTPDAYKAYTKAFDRYLRGGKDRLTADEVRAMSVGDDLNGGFLVTPDKTGRIVAKIFETSDVRRHASVQMISTDALEGSADLDEASGGWVSETGTRSDSTSPKVPTPWKIPVHELHSSPKATQKLLNDANVDVASWLTGKVGNKLARLQNTAFVTGTGTGKPRGFASYTTAATADSARSWGVFEHVATGSAGSFGTDPNGVQKLISLMGKLKDAYAARAAFFSNRLTKFAIRGLTDASSAGKFIFIPSFAAGVPDTILGAPHHTLQDMADYTTTDALALAYGDMGETYQIVDRQGVSVLVDPYTAKPYVVFYTTARVGGDAVSFESMKFLKFGTS
jgi:HK97 family phage major capsid protein